LPKLTAEAFLADPISLVADETLGIAIANYIGGTLAIHNFLYYDRMKPGISKRLSPFMDDAVCGLVAGVMSKVLRE
jgi:alpha-ribazole phosphatase CobZ